MPKKALQRSIRLELHPSKTGTGVFCVKLGEKQQYYTFREIPCEIGGRGFILHRLGLGTPYHVRVGKPAESSCECLGFLRHGHCKHIAALDTLLKNELL